MEVFPLEILMILNQHGGEAWNREGGSWGVLWMGWCGFEGHIALGS